jgi:sec-independent protein translocase protein TatA
MTPVLGEIVGWELLLVVALVALLFGSSQIPKFARSIGEASREFRKGVDEAADDEPTGEKSSGEKSSGDKSTEGKPTEGKPTEGKPTEGNTEGKPTDDPAS